MRQLVYNKNGVFTHSSKVKRKKKQKHVCEREDKSKKEDEQMFKHKEKLSTAPLDFLYVHKCANVLVISPNVPMVDPQKRSNSNHTIISRPVSFLDYMC